MIKKPSVLALAVLGILGMGLLSGCGAGGGGESSSTPATPAAPAASVPANIVLLVSSPQVNSDMVGAPTVALTAIVKDGGNQALTAQEITFSADSGVLSAVSAKTDVDGRATAKLGAGGDPSNRTIRISATAGTVSAVNTVSVTGTQVSIDSPSFTLPFNDPVGKQLVISLKDSAGAAITGRTIAMSAASGSTFSAATFNTDNNGQITVTVKNATDTVGDTITASAIGASAQSVLAINTAKLDINPPAANATVDINTLQPFTVTYTKSNAPPVVEPTIYFTTTRGTLTDPLTSLPVSSKTTVGGVATVSVSSSNSGPAVLTAYTADGTTQVSKQASIVFVAKTPAKMALSAYPAVINTNAPSITSEKSLIKAIVRDASDNLVMNKAVDFSIIQDASAGTLTGASSTTDMYGTATTNFIAGSSPSGLNGVKITATVQDTPTVKATTSLTVGGQAMSITLATGPTIQKVEPNKYQKDYVALVTDNVGRPVVNAVVTATATPLFYAKGFYYICGDQWCQMKTLVASKSTNPAEPACWNEDGITQNPLYDFNGVLDPGEDQNANSRLDPGNVVSVTASTTDSTGHSTVSLVYARDYAHWVTVRLEVRASLAGSTTSAIQSFNLIGLAADYTDKTVIPPGHPSPFGSNTTCYPSLSALTLSPTKISLNWDQSAYADYYRIYRIDNNGVGPQPGSPIVNNYRKTSYDDLTVTGGNQYCYQINQVDAAGVESVLTKDPVCAASQPSAPAFVTATTLSPAQIQVSWTDTGASSYRIYKNNSFLQDSVTRSIVSGNLSANTQYCYAVTSLDSTGAESSKSGSACSVTTVSALPVTPTGVTIASTVIKQVDLSWAVQAPAPWGYKIYKDGAFYMSVQGTSNALSDTLVTSGTVACYTVSAFDNQGNESAQSGQACVSVR